MEGRNKVVVITEADFMDVLVDTIIGLEMAGVIESFEDVQAQCDEEMCQGCYHTMRFQKAFQSHLGYAPTKDSLQYAVEKYSLVS